MAKINEQFDENSGPKISAELKKDLAEMFEPPQSVPMEVDMAILDNAGRKLVRRQWRHNIIRRIGIIAATAAVVIFAFSLDLSRMSKKSTEDSYFAETQSADIDRSGRVDILDAFKLAKRLESAEQIDSSFDMNGDGLVNRGDVDFIAKTAVHLNKGVI
ncbi:MAG: hypothetical protein JW715_05240 [Sedimentisphaerales bacterium]|nr:hypothetical protein [Sedimentisphaerales bacterium]